MLNEDNYWPGFKCVAVELITGNLSLIETVSFMSLHMICVMDPLMLNALYLLNKCNAL
jgi:hypothetical protein